MCNEMEWHGEKVLNTLTEMYLTLQTFLVMKASRCLQYKKLVACIAQVWFWLILLQNTNSLQIMRFHGPLLWTLIFCYFHRFSIGFKSDDWLGHSSSFIFFLWNQLRFSLAVCLGLFLSAPSFFHVFNTFPDISTFYYT